MPPPQPQPQPPTLGINEILFILFKHKWKILFCTAAGIAAAASVYFLQTPVYRSEAKLLVRYLVDRRPMESIENLEDASKATPAVISAEVDLLTSADLAVAVAEAVGPARLMPSAGTAATATAAAGQVRAGLVAGSQKGSNVIVVSYTHRDPELARRVLEELITRYFKKHLEVHRSVGAADFVNRQTDAAKARLGEIEASLKEAKSKAKTGIFSVAEHTASLNTGIANLQEQLHVAEAQRAEQYARLQEFQRSAGGSAPNSAELKPRDPNDPAAESATDGDADSQETPNLDSGTAAPGGSVAGPVSSADVQQYQALVARLGQLRRLQLELSSKYTPGNELVKANDNQIAALEAQRAQLEAKSPALVATRASGIGGGPNLLAERARLAGIEARIQTLKSRLTELQDAARQFSELAPEISRLERQRELEDANHRALSASYEKARIDQLMEGSAIPNISPVQNPSLAAKVTADRNKVVLGFLGGGIALGLACAFVIEMVFNRTIKHPLELETRLHIPLLLTIPLTSVKNRRRLRASRQDARAGSGVALSRRGSASLAPWQPDHFIREFADAIRDRLVLHFEMNSVKHKPKLIAVAGFSRGAGSSTVAGGLAAALSETDAGKVLLVDLNAGGAEMHHFHDGGAVSPLREGLENGGGPTPAGENLYLAAAAPTRERSPQSVSKNLYELMPQLKASEFDYIIFDMPPLTPTSPTLALSRLMDQVLLVVEAEKNDVEMVRRAYRELLASKANVSAVYNKARSYAPKWLTSEG